MSRAKHPKNVENLVRGNALRLHRIRARKGHLPRVLVEKPIGHPFPGTVKLNALNDKVSIRETLVARRIEKIWFESFNLEGNREI